MTRSEEPIDPGISCSHCAAVCCRLTVVLLPGDRVPSWFTTHDENGVECMDRRDDGWCVALDRDTMRCTIHAHRPQVCRDFAMAGAACRTERSIWYRSRTQRIPAVVVDRDR